MAQGVTHTDTHGPRSAYTIFEPKDLSGSAIQNTARPYNRDI